MESFAQQQWDEIHEIDVRLLYGAGGRFSIIDSDTNALHLGLLGMYEFENTSPDDALSEQNRHVRLSGDLSAGVKLGSVLINHNTYYQPRVQDWADFRVNSETSIQVNINDRLSLSNSFTLIYDANPPETVRETRYNLSSGLAFEF